MSLLNNNFLKLGKSIYLNVVSFFKEPNTILLPINKEQRLFIHSYFPENNGLMTYSGKDDGNYVLTDNVHAHFGKGIISFYNEDGQLKAGVAYHASISDRMNPKARPLIHYEVDIVNEKSMIKLKEELAENSVNSSIKKFKIN